MQVCTFHLCYEKWESVFEDAKINTDFYFLFSGSNLTQSSAFCDILLASNQPSRIIFFFFFFFVCEFANLTRWLKWFRLWERENSDPQGVEHVLQTQQRVNSLSLNLHFHFLCFSAPLFWLIPLQHIHCCLDSPRKSKAAMKSAEGGFCCMTGSFSWFLS